MVHTRAGRRGEGLIFFGGRNCSGTASVVFLCVMALWEEPWWLGSPGCSPKPDLV